MNWTNFLSGLSYVSLGSVLMPILTFFLAKKKNHLRRIILVFLFVSLMSEIANETYVFLGHRGYLIYNIFFVCQITLLCLVYLKMLTNKVIVKIVMWAFPLLAFCYSIFFQSINEFQSAIRVIGGILMISFSLKYFWQMYCYLPADNLFRFLKGWINIAVFSYFAFNLFLFACANYIFQNESPVVAMAFWSFHNLNNIIKNCLFALGLYLGTDTQADSEAKEQVQ